MINHQPYHDFEAIHKKKKENHKLMTKANIRIQALYIKHFEPLLYMTIKIQIVHSDPIAKMRFINH